MGDHIWPNRQWPCASDSIYTVHRITGLPCEILMWTEISFRSIATHCPSAYMTVTRRGWRWIDGTISCRPRNYCCDRFLRAVVKTVVTTVASVVQLLQHWWRTSVYLYTVWPNWVMVRVVKFSRPKIGKFAVESRPKTPNPCRICGNNYRNTKEPNSSFRCKTQTPFSLSITNL